MNSKLVDEVEKCRSRNNKLWMAILRLALEAKPVETKSLLSEINKNDRYISDLLGKLADG